MKGSLVTADMSAPPQCRNLVTILLTLHGQADPLSPAPALEQVGTWSPFRPESLYKWLSRKLGGDTGWLFMSQANREDYPRGQPTSPNMTSPKTKSQVFQEGNSCFEDKTVHIIRAAKGAGGWHSPAPDQAKEPCHSSPGQ